MTDVDPVSMALITVFQSPNEADSNGEIANVVDGLFYIGRAIYALAIAVEQMNCASPGMATL